MTRNIYFHVGYPKTATTSLQKNVFDKLKSVNYLGKKYVENGFCFDQNIEQYYYDKVSDLGVIEDDRDIFISDEGVLAFHKITERYSPVDPVKRMKRYADFIGAELKVIVVVRSLLELLPSSYAQGYGDKYKFVQDLDTYEKYVCFLKSNYQNQLVEDLLSPQKYLEKVEQIVGKDGLYVSSYSLLKSNQKEFLKRLSHFMKIDEKMDSFGEDNVKNIAGSYHVIDHGWLGNMIIRAKHRNKRFYKFMSWFLAPIKSRLLSVAFLRKNLKKHGDMRLASHLTEYLESLDRETETALKENYSVDLHSC